MNWILAGLGFMGFALAMSAAISDFTGGRWMLSKRAKEFKISRQQCYRRTEGLVCLLHSLLCLSFVATAFVDLDYAVIRTIQILYMCVILLSAAGLWIRYITV